MLPANMSARFLDNVYNAYAHANASLLNLLLTTHALPARLRSMKHYFFLDRSDFFSYFLDLSTSELKKPAKKVNVGKLQSLLDLVLRQPGTVAAQDPYKEDVKVEMNQVGLTEWLTLVLNVKGIDQDDAAPDLRTLQTPAVIAADQDKGITGINALELNYLVPFPLSLVISRKTVLRYQLLFRHLLALRHLETLLANSWQDHSKGSSWKHKSSNPKIEMWKRRVFTLRARMLVFVQQLLYYCTSEVIEPEWQGLMAKMDTNKSPETGDDKQESKQVGRTVDELMQDHLDFLDSCLKACMLTNDKLLKVRQAFFEFRFQFVLTPAQISSKIMNTCAMFATYTAQLSRNLVAADKDLASASGTSSGDGNSPNPSSSSTAFDPQRLDKLTEIMQKYENNFNRHLRILLDSLDYYAATETVVLLGLCARLSTVGGVGGRGRGFISESGEGREF
jgi:gamma-tubulin complex component 2